MEISGLIDRANLLLEQGRFRDAEKQIKQALEKEPQNDNALAVLARCYFNSGQIDKGIEVIQQAIGIDAENDFYYYLLGFGYYQKSDYPFAIKMLNQAIEINPYGAEYFGLLSFVFIDEKQFEQGLEKADEGLAIDADNLTCLNARSMALNKMSKTDEAIETMQDALSKDPDNHFTHATMGWNFLEKGKHQEATKHFREALRINPDSEHSRTGLKEALKSKIPPYKWLLQFNFWMNNKGKTFRWAFVIGLLIVVRLISGLSKENPGFENIGMLVAGAYLVFVATSWVINPMANVFLLLHPEGKYALDSSEKWNARGFIICIASGIGMMLCSGLMKEESQSSNYIIAGLIVLACCIPAGHMLFPVKWKGNSFSQWVAMALLVLAILTVLVVLFALPNAEVLFVLFFIGFILYSWTGSF